MRQTFFAAVDNPQDPRRETLWVCSLVLLAFLIRFLPALVPHFWFDEVITVATIQAPFKHILAINIQGVHPPFFYFWTKCLGAVGRRLGGPFATLAWLRLASVLPGLLACLLAWWVARRHWGGRRALWTLALFACSPALTYYSVELRNYASAQCLLLAGLIALLGALDPRARRPAAWAALFTLIMTLALYTHALCALYLGAMGAIVLAELALRRGEWRRLLGRVIPSGSALALCYLPWLPVVFAQVGWLNSQDYVWLPWAGWRDLATTFFWYLPLGFLNPDFDRAAWPWFVVAALGAGIGALGALAFRRALHAGRQPGRPEDSASFVPGRLMAYTLVMALLPLLIIFLLSYSHLSRSFLGKRYNLMAAPFFNLALLGLIFGLRRRWLRLGVLAAVLGLSAASSATALWQRVHNMDAVGQVATALPAGAFTPASRLYWVNPVGLPWLGQCGSFRVESFEQAFAAAGGEAAPGDAYFLSYEPLNSSRPFSAVNSVLLEKLLVRRGAAALAAKGSQLWDWAGIWRVSPRDLPGLAAEWRARAAAIEARRQAIAGGQVLLADVPGFRTGKGWSPLDLNADLMPERWTMGPRQRLSWDGPARPGRYQVEVKFWRSHPFPAKEIAVRYRLPGAPWRQMQAGLGAVTLAGEVRTSRPGQRLRLDMETPTWIPAEHFPGSDDHRPLGMIFAAIELRPLDVKQ